MGGWHLFLALCAACFCARHILHRSVSEEKRTKYICYVLVGLFVKCILFINGEDEAGAAGQVVSSIAALEVDVLVQGEGRDVSAIRKGYSREVQVEAALQGCNVAGISGTGMGLELYK